MFEPDVLRQEDALIACRRRLHERPELSFCEFETTEYLENALREMGVDELSRPCKTGLIAVIHGTKPGSTATLGVRADIDALPIQEDNDLPYRSKTPGVMHACGHDAHAAIALTLARLLCARRSELCGTVRILFQHAEELPPGGAIEMVRAGAAEGLDAVLGIHLSTTFPSGHFGVRAGALTANTDRFDITILGKGGHCALPETCIDPVVTGAQIILALQTLVSRKMAAVDPAVVSVCQANAGNAYNIIPNTMTLTGTTRCLGPQALFPGVPVRGLLGGMHLMRRDAQAEKTVEFLRTLPLTALYPSHCTAFPVRAQMAQTLPVQDVGVGMTLEL